MQPKNEKKKKKENEPGNYIMEVPAYEHREFDSKIKSQMKTQASGWSGFLTVFFFASNKTKHNNG